VRLIAIFFLLSAYTSFAQATREEDKLMASLNFGTSLPAGLLSMRSIALYENTYTEIELQEIQKYFQQAGIDAVSYIDIDYVLSGPEPSRIFSTYFNSRNTKFFILLQKKDNEYQIAFTEYNGTKSFVDKAHTSWKLSDASLSELLRSIYRFAVSTQKKENFLINDIPETGIFLNFFKGKQDERFSPDIRLFKSAIPRWGNEADDKELEAFLKENFKAK